MMNAFKSALAAATLLSGLGATPAHAAILYSQPGNEVCTPSCWTSHLETMGFTGYQAFDNFMLTSDAVVTSVQWQGLYIDPGNPSVAPTPNTSAWGLFFYFDAGPGVGPTGLAALDFPDAIDVTTTRIGTGDFGGAPVNLYAFEFSFATPLALAAGRYWFSPVSFSSTFAPFFSWTAASTDGDGITLQAQDGGLPSEVGHDRAFTLFGSSVPEPASWAMMIAGLALVGGAMRRRPASGLNVSFQH